MPIAAAGPDADGHRAGRPSVDFAALDQASFRRLLGEVLPHLYEPAYVLEHPLASALVHAGLIRAPEEIPRYLMAAIEDLRPPGPAPHSSPGWRQYRYLRLRYVDGLGHRRIADDLSLSTRQMSREHDAGLQALARLLWSRYRDAIGPARHASSHDLAGGDQDVARRSALEAEILALGSQRPTAPVRLDDVLQGVLATVSRMAAGAGVVLRTELEPGLPAVVVSPHALRHIMLNLLSHAIGAARSGATILVHASAGLAAVDVAISLDGPSTPLAAQPRRADEPNALDMARRLASLQGIQLDVEADPSGLLLVGLSLPTRRARTVLYVDDSPEMGRLFRQYLAGSGYAVVHVRTAERALQVVRATPPDAIVLDVLLPTEDGWQLLERLRAHDETARTPVIVCTVLPVENLAESLEVAAFLPKPVSQTALLSVLGRCCPLGA